MPATASFRTQIGTAQIWQRDPEYTDFEKFCFCMSLGAQNFDAYRRTVAARRQLLNGGYHETHNYGSFFGDVQYTAFAETRERCEEIVKMLVDKFSVDWRYRIRFSAIQEIDGEFVATGSRNTSEGWS